ncbi:MAG TPA: phosphatase PAP2-related protein [Candidatus Paceibacterota bacterium]
MKRAPHTHNTSELERAEVVKSSLIGLSLLAISFVVNYVAGVYADKNQSNFVNDIVLSNIPPFDVNLWFVYGALAMGIFVIILCLTKPRRIPYLSKSVALFIVIRSLFISVTHLGSFPTKITVDSAFDFFHKISFTGDLFFSGHTGIPFLLALIFWKHEILRPLFLGISVLFAVLVLLGHLHYSIDVLGAFFITYTIYHLSEVLFKKDKKMFDVAG